MPTNKDLQMIADRGLQALAEVKAHAVTLANLQRDIQVAQATLAALQGKIDQAQGLAGQVEEMHQHLRAKQSELAELQATIARKNVEHGTIDGDLRSLMKRAQKLTEAS